MILKITLVFIVLYFLKIKLTDLPISSKVLKNAFVESNWSLLFLVLILVTVNWGLEGRKWQLLLRNIEETTWFQAFKVVLMGLVVGFVTPAKIGDISFRYLSVSESNRKHVIGAAMLSRWAQLIITLLIGTIGALFFLLRIPKVVEHIPVNNSLEGMWMIALFLMAVVICFAMFFNLKYLITLFPIKRLQQYVEILGMYSRMQLGHILTIALFRYAVFTLQYVLILNAFSIELSIEIVIVSVMVIFLIKSIIPFFNVFGGLGLREAIALMVFGMIGDFRLTVLVGSTSLWVLNILLPSVVGLLFFISKKQIR